MMRHSLFPHIHHHAKTKNCTGFLHLVAFLSAVLIARAVQYSGNMYTLLTAGGWDIQTAVPGISVSPPPPQAIERHENTAAEAAAPEAPQQPVHEPAAAAQERPSVQQPALGHP